jgi:hypothetical protein
VYRGKGGYRNYHKIRSDAHTKESLAVKGPVRGNSFFRASIRIDHDPCICKDYKETGFCGFGDSCKFIHDRGDYKLGWMIEREQGRVVTFTEILLYMNCTMCESLYKNQ